MNHKKRNLLLALRNGINKITGKQALIDEYESVIHELIDNYDKMPEGPNKQALFEKINKLTEAKPGRSGSGSIWVGNFNEYSARKKVLKNKITEGQKLIKTSGNSR